VGSGALVELEVEEAMEEEASEVPVLVCIEVERVNQSCF